MGLLRFSLIRKSELAGHSAPCYFAAHKFINGGNGMRLRTILLSCLLLLAAGCSTDDPTRHNTFIPLTSIEVTGAYDSMAVHTVNQYTAIGDFSGSFTRDITTEVSWGIADESIASASNDTGSQGLVTGVSPGETSVIAMYGDVSGSAPVIVTNAVPAAVEITPQGAELQVDITQQYEAVGVLSDNSTQDITLLATWTSSDPDVAAIDDSGLVTTLASGSTTITAVWQGIEASTSLLVTGARLNAITITPGEATIAQGTTVQLQAEGTYTDGTSRDITDSVNWQSSDSGIAVVDNNLVEGIRPGQAEVSASFDLGGNAISATAVIHVSSAVIESIRVTPENSIIVKGTSQQFTAIGFFSDNSQQDITGIVTWLSTDETVGTISNSAANPGQFVSNDFGTTFIVASFEGISGDAPLRVQ
jgi:hypothetical protein